MNGKQAKEIMINYGGPKFQKLGYELKKTRDTEALFINNNSSLLLQLNI